MFSKDQMTALITLTLVSCVREPQPSGHLYAQAMADVDPNMTAGQWNAFLKGLKDQDVITESNFLVTLTAKGSGIAKRLQSILNS